MSFHSRVNVLLGAVVASTFGDGLVPAAFAIQSFRLDHSGRLLTAVLIALWAAKLISSLILDKIPASRFPARLMIASDTGRAIAQAGLVLWMILTPDLWPIAMVLSSFLYGLCAPWFGPHRFSLLSIILNDAERHKANSVLAMTSDALFLAGPLVGTTLTLGLGFTKVLIIDVITFALSILFISYYWNSSHEETKTQNKDLFFTPTESTRESGSLPSWVNSGLSSWLVVSIAIGFLGSAAPTVVMGTFGESTWGWIAVAGSAGSLIGSFISNYSILKNRQWNLLQCVLCVAYILHLSALSFSSTILVIAVATALSGAITAISGIIWDVMGQEFDTAERVHRFAVRDQIVNTVGIPAGMVIFAALGASTPTAFYLVMALLAVAALLCLQQRSIPTDKFRRTYVD
ncbi:MFS transporter [Corynebacterium poyangense]|uniref:MFS transporter n=1 Tax=Corynebacterium poyangense TaxID=2684405 RepID=UPI00165D0BF9|nr:MFS transporter [Corynebacterium poyangense]